MFFSFIIRKRGTNIFAKVPFIIFWLLYFKYFLRNHILSNFANYRSYFDILLNVRNDTLLHNILIQFTKNWINRKESSCSEKFKNFSWKYLHLANFLPAMKFTAPSFQILRKVSQFTPLPLPLLLCQLKLHVKNKVKLRVFDLWKARPFKTFYL